MEIDLWETEGQFFLSMEVRFTQLFFVLLLAVACRRQVENGDSYGYRQLRSECLPAARP